MLTILGYKAVQVKHWKKTIFFVKL
jgi:hypothetical protein